MIDFFKELFAYSHHFNQKLVTVFIEQADKTSEKSVIWFNHILNAHYVWNSRILPGQNTAGPWDMHATSGTKRIGPGLIIQTPCKSWIGLNLDNASCLCHFKRRGFYQYNQGYIVSYCQPFHLSPRTDCGRFQATWNRTCGDRLYFL